MSQINPYLNFNGNTEEAFNFYKSVFGGDFAAMMRYGDTPGCADVPEDEKDKIMHVALPLGNNMIMGTDVLKSMENVNHGTGISLCISADSRNEADRFFAGLVAGGRAIMPLQDMFWGSYYGMLADKFGVQWMIEHSEKQQ